MKTLTLPQLRSFIGSSDQLCIDTNIVSVRQIGLKLVLHAQQHDPDDYLAKIADRDRQIASLEANNAGLRIQLERERLRLKS